MVAVGQKRFPNVAIGSISADSPGRGRIAFMPKKIALISRDWLTAKSGAFDDFSDKDMGFSPYFKDISHAASKAGVDTLLFCLGSHDASKLGELSHVDLFPIGTVHQCVILGIKRKNGERVEIHIRAEKSAYKSFTQEFGKSSAKKELKNNLRAALSADDSNRIVGQAVILACGETNIIQTRREPKGQIDDPYGCLSTLRSKNIQLLLNPIHTYMRRWEMGLKRAALSKAARTVVCVWNRTNSGEAHNPWAAFHKGRSIEIEEIQPIPPIPKQPGIRIGVLELPRDEAIGDQAMPHK